MESTTTDTTVIGLYSVEGGKQVFPSPQPGAPPRPKNNPPPVIYVRRHDAKVIKTWLEDHSCLDKRFRMSPVDATDMDLDMTRVHYDDGNEDNDDGDCGGGGDDIIDDAFRNHRSDDGGSSRTPPSPPDDNSGVRDIIKDCIAVPVTDGYMERFANRYYNFHDAKRRLIDNRSRSSGGDGSRYAPGDDGWLARHDQKIIGFGRYTCPLSTSMLGNNNKRIVVENTSHRNSDANGHQRSSSSSNPPLTNVQHVLIEALTSWLDPQYADHNTKNNRNTVLTQHHPRDIHGDVARVETLTRRLSNRTCPRKLEIIGDDRTVVIPRWSFFVDGDSGSENNCNSHQTKGKTNQNECYDEFRKFLIDLALGRKYDRSYHDGRHDEATADASFFEMQSLLWEKIASDYRCSRVVRRGDVDPESGVRESGHRILWPIPQDDEESKDCRCNLGYAPTSTGLASPGWITVTEHGIRQSYDLTRVMFSRGNVTEKKRFGTSCVRADELVLDMYAGIGYYTLPALILGKARHVTACEWNEHALHALRYNLEANGVGEDRATVLEGDCRASLKRLLLRGDASFDRISLGLLPSSEGGWDVAVSCLNRGIGGWLHVHANVPTMERRGWTHWLCQSLTRIAASRTRSRRRNDCRADGENGGRDAASTHDGGDDGNDDEWIAVVRHVEKVKSFAPMVDHVVADVFVGPRYSPKAPAKESGVFDSSGMFSSIDPLFDVTPPSCALNEEGILNQNWLRG